MKGQEDKIPRVLFQLLCFFLVFVDVPLLAFSSGGAFSRVAKMTIKKRITKKIQKQKILFLYKKNSHNLISQSPLFPLLSQRNSLPYLSCPWVPPLPRRFLTRLLRRRGRMISRSRSRRCHSWSISRRHPHRPRQPSP